MPRSDNKGTKSTRKQKNIDYQRTLKERKRLRRARAARYAHLRGQQKIRVGTLDQEVAKLDAAVPARAKKAVRNAQDARNAQIEVLNKETVKELRRRCEAGNLPVRSRDTKMSMVLLLMGEHPRQQSALVEPS